MIRKHKAWATIENPEGIYKFGWVILLQSGRNEAQISSTRWYKTKLGSKKACRIWAEKLGLHIEWKTA